MKQETLEETFDKVDDELCRYSTEESNYWKHYRIGVLDGLKWQQERSYSEEELHKIIGSYQAHIPLFNHEFTYDMWFEQFKK